MINKKFIKAVLMQYSGIVGAGIFILPYLFYHSNFHFVLFWLLILAIVMMYLESLYIDIVVHTKGHHQLAGYAQKYLGKKFSFLATANMLVLGFGVTSAFIRLGSGFLGQLLPGSPLIVYELIFLSFLGLFHSSGHRFIERITQYIPLASVVIILILFATSIGKSFGALSFPPPNYEFFGGLIFAITGFVIIPDVYRFLKREKNKNKKLIWSNRCGTCLAALTYVIFVIAVLLISGPNLSPDAISGLLKSAPHLGIIIAILGIVLTFKACLNFIHSLKVMFLHDYNFSRDKSLLLSLSVPFLALLLSGFSFSKIISLTGTVTISVSAFIIVCVKLSQWKRKLKKSKKSSTLSM